MQTFAEYWCVYLIVAVVCMGYALFNQVRRMKGMLSGSNDPFETFGKGLVAMALAGFAGSVSFILFLVAVIWMIVRG